MLYKEDLQRFVQEKLGDYQFVVVSNRQPYEHVIKKGRIEAQRTMGGVITAIDPVMQVTRGLWVACSSGQADMLVTNQFDKVMVPPDNPSYELKRIQLSKEEEEGYYYGYSNEALWPLCHTAFQRPVFRQKDWQHYVKVNQRFAQAIMDEIGSAKAFIWIQDYHFCLLPKYLKEMAGDQLIIAHFWHIPWPCYEVFRICPQKSEILEGMLANDMIGFHTHYHCNNFIEVVDRHLESKIDRERFSVIRQNHETLIRPYPISIDFAEINQEINEMGEEQIHKELKEEFQLGNCPLLLGVDRIDYTKGIPERLRAIGRLLDTHPELKEQMVFLQIGVLSRIHIESYKDLNDEINSLVEEINWTYSTDTWVPIIFVRCQLPLSKLVALYRMACVNIVSSLHDGMNLVAKEYVSARNDEDGVLVLSQFAGSARELSDAVLVNPFDDQQFSEGIYQALTMNRDERRKRMQKMRQVVCVNNIYRWAGKFLSGLLKIEFKERGEYEKSFSLLG